MVGRVDPAGCGVDHLRQLVGVGGFELAEAAVFQQQLGQRIIQRQLRQHLFRRGWRALGRLLDHRQFQLLNRISPSCLGEPEVEFLARQLIGLASSSCRRSPSSCALLSQQLAGQQRALALYTRQHRHQGHLDS